jgi:predicted O-methyltransferase YrrM
LPRWRNDHLSSTIRAATRDGVRILIDISSGHARLDGFLADGYMRVRGMSSRFAAAICGHVVRRQSGLGITGDLLEIGTFEGRFFIAMAMLLEPGEHALGIDVFTWPSPAVYDHLLENCAAAGLPDASYTAWKVDTRAITAADLRARLPAEKARFIHIDGEHIPDCLRNDLSLAHAVLHPGGVIALDDMLHPGYPTLMVAVQEYLGRHPEMCVLCVIDRETIVAATKFVLCRTDWFKRYEARLLEDYKANVWPLGADFEPHWCLVLSLDTKLAEIG